MQLSGRLAAIAQLCADAESLADIGTDHGYLPIYLLLHGQLKRAIAMDVNKGPLQRAAEHVKQYDLEDRISLRLSDGAAALKAREADTVVIAGMGGALTVRILTQGRDVLAGTARLVLQPQSEIAGVRRFLHQNGYAIERERMVKEDGKFYPMMRAVHGRQEPWQPYEYSYGKLLIAQQDPVLMEYLGKEKKKYREIVEKLGADLRADELKSRLEEIALAEGRMMV